MYTWSNFLHGVLRKISLQTFNNQCFIFHLFAWSKSWSQNSEASEQAHSLPDCVTQAGMRYSFGFDVSSDECAILTLFIFLHCPSITRRFKRLYPGACVYSPQDYLKTYSSLANKQCAWRITNSQIHRSKKVIGTRNVLVQFEQYEKFKGSKTDVWCLIFEWIIDPKESSPFTIDYSLLTCSLLFHRFRTFPSCYTATL